ncbi:MAG: ATP-binding protein [Candidatus Freyarchaeota archaeon]|nr:4Fe-4S binding protein [Candidatus Freyrarchaeum guaymaensis]
MGVKEFKSGDITITIDHDKCTGCGSCVEACPSEVFEVQDEKSVAVRVEDCVECCSCVEACPENAISHSSC